MKCLCDFDLNKEASMEEVLIQEVPVYQAPIQENVYRLEMVTPDYGITSQPIFSPGDQWSMPLMQWEMTPQHL